ncbi:MAG: ecsA [Phycisphaerales bacterium]|nr:ecsA [Phycisphaerales bacterium]
MQSAPTTDPAAAAPAAAPPILDVVDYHKAYGDFVAVDGLSFAVGAGQVVGLLGPNGAGKTTTMRAIAGIIPPTRGRVAVDGFDVTTDPVEAKRRLAYVPDDPKLFETLTVWEHLRFVAAAYDVPDLVDAGEELLARFELTGKRDTLAQELSRGMRQKVAICCAYLHRPRLLLLDEPLTGLDPRGIRTMKQSLAERAAAGSAVVVSSHLLSLVEDLCTHLLIVNRGRRLFYGRTDEVRAAFAGAGTDGSAEDASLEEVFFRATET